MSTAGQSSLTQEDALTAAKRSPPARYLRGENAWKTSKGAAAPSPPARLARSGPGTAAPRKGLKSLPNSGTWRGEGGARAPAAGGGRGSRCPAGAVSLAGGGAEGFRGAPAPQPSRLPRPRLQRRRPRASRRGPGAPPGRMRCPGRAPRRSRPLARVGGRAEAESHTSARWPQTPRVPSPPPPPGAGPAGGARSPEPGSAPGNGRCFSRKGFLERSGDGGGGGRAREAGAAGGQSRSAFRTLPGNRGDLRASPHPARLLAAFPPRPSSRPPIPVRRRLRGGAWSTTPPPELPRPLQSDLGYDGQTPWPVGRGVRGASETKGVVIHPPHPPPPPPAPPSSALPRREPRPLGRVRRTARFQGGDRHRESPIRRRRLAESWGRDFGALPRPGEAGREPAGEVPDSDTPPLELFSRSRALLPEEQILSTIYGKSAILHNYGGVGGGGGRGGRGLSPGSAAGALSSIPDPVFRPRCGLLASGSWLRQVLGVHFQASLPSRH